MIKHLTPRTKQEIRRLRRKDFLKHFHRYEIFSYILMILCVIHILIISTSKMHYMHYIILLCWIAILLLVMVPVIINPDSKWSKWWIKSL
jgi:cell division protein FtsW (lipid II flippase)